MTKKPKLLWVGDAGFPTGFERVTRNVLLQLHPEYDITVMGVNYRGDPDQAKAYPFPIWPCTSGEHHDMLGVGRLKEMYLKVKPDVICFLNDPWIVRHYVEEARDAGITVPLAAYMPVDAKFMDPEVAAALNGLNLAIFYTQFGVDQAEQAGYTGATCIIPHGVDTKTYRPADRAAARAIFKLPAEAFFVGNVNRNQPRKRLDLSILWFGEWWRRAGQPKDAYLHLHATNNDIGWDLMKLARYAGLDGRMFLSGGGSLSAFVPEHVMAMIYASQNVHVNTGQGEGWGLTTHESMACGIANIVTKSAALGEWPGGACFEVPVGLEIGTTNGTPGHIATVGAIPDREAWIAAIDQFYHSPGLQAEYGQKALKRATDPMFTWENVGKLFHAALESARLGRAVEPEGAVCA